MQILLKAGLALAALSAVGLAAPRPAAAQVTESIHRYSSTGVDLGVFAADNAVPYGLAFSSSGVLFASNNQSDRVDEFSPTGQVVGSLAGSGLSDPFSLAFNKAGDLFVGSFDGGQDGIHEFSPSGADLGLFATSSGLATSLAVDASGDVFATTRNLTFGSPNNVLQEFSPTGALLKTFPTTTLHDPTGLAFDAAGNLYVGTGAEGGASPLTIERFSPSGQDLGQFGGALVPYNDLPTFSFDAAGDLLLIPGNSRQITRFSSSGAPLGVFAQGGQYDDFHSLAIGPTGDVFVGVQTEPPPALPEASTTVSLGLLLALGLGGVIVTARKRKANGAA